MTARWHETHASGFGTECKCKRCGKVAVPGRERLRQILDGALHSLNAAKLADTLKGNIAEETVVELAAMAHAMLYALSALDHCEPCIEIQIERASALIVGRIGK